MNFPGSWCAYSVWISDNRRVEVMPPWSILHPMFCFTATWTNVFLPSVILLRNEELNLVNPWKLERRDEPLHIPQKKDSFFLSAQRDAKTMPLATRLEGGWWDLRGRDLPTLSVVTNIQRSTAGAAPTVIRTKETHFIFARTPSQSWQDHRKLCYAVSSTITS